MLVDISNNIHVVEPSPQLTAWVEANMKVPNKEYERRVRMNKWLGNLKPHINLYEWKGDILVLPYGVWDLVPQEIKQGVFVNYRFPDNPTVDYGGEVPLYDYQQDALSACLLADGGILQSPAGSGKTQIGIALAMAIGRRTLWLTHTADLLAQSKARAMQYIKDSLIGTITQGKVNVSGGITFATVQTMAKMDLTEYRDYWDVIIVDECHRVAGTPTAMTMFSYVLASLRARYKYGLSATVHRADGMIKATYALLGRVFYEVPASAVADRIMPVTVSAVATGVGMSSECLSPDGMLDYAGMINYLTAHEGRNKSIINIIRSEPKRSWLILTDRVEHSAVLMDMLPEPLKKYAVTINGRMTSKTGRSQREGAIEAMRAGRKRFLFATYRLAKEGLDIPRLDRLILATPQRDYAVIVQSVGRIARAFPDKGEPVCYDLVDNIPYLIKCYKQRCASYRKAGCKL